MKQFITLIVLAVLVCSCNDKTDKVNQAENNNSVIVVMDSQTSTMYQNPDTLEFIRQNIIKNGNWNPESIEEIKMYFGTEGSRKSMLNDLRININIANSINEPLSKTDIAWNNSNEELGAYCQNLKVLCDTLISNQRRILAILNEDYSKCNFYCVIKFKNESTWEYSGIITGGLCISFGDVLWDLNEMGR